MNYTDNYDLKQPEYNDYILIEDLNENAATIDTELNNLATNLGATQTGLQESIDALAATIPPQIQAIQADITALQQQGGKYIGQSFATKADLDNFSDFTGINVGDFTYVEDDETQQDALTRYIFGGVTFDFAYIINYDPIELATNTTAGTVKTGSAPGQVSLNANGVATVNKVLKYKNPIRIADATATDITESIFGIIHSSDSAAIGLPLADYFIEIYLDDGYIFQRATLVNGSKSYGRYNYTGTGWNVWRENVSYPIGIDQGGTGATTASAALANLSGVPTSRTINGYALSQNVTLNKNDVGLPNVDNTADADKFVAHANTAVSADHLISTAVVPISQGGTGNTTGQAQNVVGIDPSAKANLNSIVRSQNALPVPAKVAVSNNSTWGWTYPTSIVHTAMVYVSSGLFNPSYNSPGTLSYSYKALGDFIFARMRFIAKAGGVFPSMANSAQGTTIGDLSLEFAQGLALSTLRVPIEIRQGMFFFSRGIFELVGSTAIIWTETAFTALELLAFYSDFSVTFCTN